MYDFWPAHGRLLPPFQTDSIFSPHYLACGWHGTLAGMNHPLVVVPGLLPGQQAVCYKAGLIIFDEVDHDWGVCSLGTPLPTRGLILWKIQGWIWHRIGHILRSFSLLIDFGVLVHWSTIASTLFLENCSPSPVRPSPKYSMLLAPMTHFS